MSYFTYACAMLNKYSVSVPNLEMMQLQFIDIEEAGKKKAEAIRTTVVPIRILIRTTVVSITPLIIHPILLSNQSAPIASGDFKIKSHIRTAARHTSLLIK